MLAGTGNELKIVEKPTSICGTSENFLLCADDAQRGILQVTLHQNGVGIVGARVKLVSCLTGDHTRRAYVTAVDLDSGLYNGNLSSLE